MRHRVYPGITITKPSRKKSLDHLRCGRRLVVLICGLGVLPSLLLVTAVRNSAQQCSPHQPPEQAQYLEEQEPVRRALVIGNADYSLHPKLPGATTDALEITARLKELKFHIGSPNELPLELKTRAEFSKAIRDFSRTINEGDLVVFYFSGHGFSYGAHGFLAPTELPQCVRENKLPDVAFPLDSIKSLLESKNPGLLIMILDACRTFSSFVIRPENPLPCSSSTESSDADINLAAGGLTQLGAGTGEVNSIIAFATEPGKTATGSSVAGQMSRYTKHVVAYIGNEGQTVLTVLSSAGADVKDESSGDQLPILISPWITNPFLRPSTQNLNDDKEAWCVALESRLKARIKRYKDAYSVTRYAADARKWLRDLSELAPAGFTLVSPVAVERAFRANNTRMAVRSLETTAFAFPREMNVGWEKDLATAEDRELGIVPSGTTQKNLALEKSGEKYLAENWGIESTPKRAEKLAFTIASIDVHENVVATESLMARAQPDEQAKVVDQLLAGTSLRVVGLAEGPNDTVWLQVLTEQKQTPLFVKVPSSAKSRPLVELGQSLKEIVARDNPDRIPDLIDALPLQDAINQLRNGGWEITWISLATGAINDEVKQGLRDARLEHARYLLKQMGVPGVRITAVTAANDFKDDGVRIRIFGVPKGGNK
jgi:hypothetical protein